VYISSAARKFSIDSRLLKRYPRPVRGGPRKQAAKEATHVEQRLQVREANLSRLLTSVSAEDEEEDPEDEVAALIFS